MRRNFGQLRFSPRPKGIPHVRKITALASLNYVTNTGDRLDTREQVGQFQTEFTNSDIVSVTHTDSFDRLVRPFAIAPASAFGRRLQLRHDAGVVPAGSSAATPAPSSTSGPFYSGHRHSIALNAARMEVTPQFSAEPSVSVNWVDLEEGSFTTKVARCAAPIRRRRGCT
jgi:hypothetical protein